MAVHLIAQDRLEEAEAILERLPHSEETPARELTPGSASRGLQARGGEEKAVRLQGEYLRAWLALSGPGDGVGPAAAAAAASARSAGSTADRHWQRRFSELRDTLAELEGLLRDGEGSGKLVRKVPVGFGERRG